MDVHRRKMTCRNLADVLNIRKRPLVLSVEYLHKSGSLVIISN